MKKSLCHSDALPGGIGTQPSQRASRRAKVFNRHELFLLILYLIRINPTHGYEIIRSVEDYSQGAYIPSPGVIYPLLSTLESEGLASGHEENGKKQFAITLRGRKYLDKQNDHLLTTLAKLKALVLTHNPRRVPDIDDAIENLKACIRKKIHRGNLNSEQVKHVRDAIDAAARAIDAL
ncbi:PadR family transcriptional regulator [Lonsdalea quercina]|uniref:PadR family transcriptional regulator n=1 Tax=Lonsdalea quercina TaxID=71657 RepID=UPI003975EED0